MCVNDLKSKLSDKEFGVVYSLLESNGSGVAYDFREFDKMFQVYGNCTKEGVKRVSPENHLLNMYKMLYISHRPVSISMIPLLTTIYLIRTSKSLYRVPRALVDKKSVYVKVIGFEAFDSSIRRFRDIYENLKSKLSDIPIDTQKGLMLSMEAIDMFPSNVGERIFKVLSDASRILTFKDKVKKGEKAFYIADGILYPYSYVAEESLEDL